MNAIRLYLLLISFTMFLNVLPAQDDFYVEPNTHNTTKTSIKQESNSLLQEQQYSTESDYYMEVREKSNEVDGTVFTDEIEVNDGEEIYNDSNDDKHRKRRNGAGAEIAAEIFVEVLYHTILFVGLFWQ